MNYLAHARQHLDAPYAVVGTGLPDLVAMADRKNRLKKRQLDDPADPAARALAMGAHAHFHDDLHFHNKPAFLALNSDIAAGLRAAADGQKTRASVLGHILVEMLLDAEYMRQHPDAAARFEHAWAKVDPKRVTDAVNRWLPRPSLRLPYVVSFFRGARFWHDYLHDDGVSYRLNQVATRVGLGHVPDMSKLLPRWRSDVAAHTDELLSIPDAASDAGARPTP